MSAQGQAAQGQGALPAKSTLVGAAGCVGRAGGFWGPCPPSCVWEGTGDSQGHIPLATQCWEGAPAKGAGGARLRVPAWVR